VQSWIALETALHKDPESDLIGITTAGHDATSLLGEKYYAALELDARRGLERRLPDDRRGPRGRAS
jgi:hypothetical protein